MPGWLRRPLHVLVLASNFGTRVADMDGHEWTWMDMGAALANRLIQPYQQAPAALTALQAGVGARNASEQRARGWYGTMTEACGRQHEAGRRAVGCKCSGSNKDTLLREQFLTAFGVALCRLRHPPCSVAAVDSRTARGYWGGGALSLLWPCLVPSVHALILAPASSRFVRE